MKKNLLFVMNNLNCGGAEKSLVSLLETIDYTRYNVSLFLFKHEGVFFRKIPKQVNLLDAPPEYKYFDMSIKTALMDCTKKGRMDVILSRIAAGYLLRKEKNKARCEQLIWKYLSKVLQSLDKKYDAAIGYLEKNPVYFCIDKVNATKKIGFIHTDYDNLGMDPEIDMNYFAKLDYIVTVSKECVNVLRRRFPMFGNKIKLLHNIVSPCMINKLSLEEPQTSSLANYKGTTIVSVGRLHPLKGFEMAVEACGKLVRNGYNVMWYLVGEGEERSRLETLIEQNDLPGRFVLLGTKENPYPYLRAADIYVQTSRFEGKSIAVDEAKILQKPIVATNFSTVKDQIKHNHNGLVVEMNSESIYQGVKKLIDEDRLRNKLINNLSKEKLGTESEIQKLYELIN